MANKKGHKQHIFFEEDLTFEANSRAAILLDNPYYTSIILYTIIGLFVAFLTWAYFSEIEEVTHADGEVIPSSEMQIIQNLEGGIVKQILIAEGDVIEQGQLLLRIDDTQAKSAFQRDRARMLTLRASIARLRAQQQHAEEISFSDDLKQYPEIIQHERGLFSAAMDEHDSMLKTLERNAELAEREYEITKPLVEKGIMSALELLKLERQVNEIQGKIAEHSDKFSREVATELSEKKAELRSVQEIVRGLKDRMVRTDVISPVRGIVHDIHVNTVGGVIKPGMEILEIVPLQDTLLIKAKIKPADIAFIHPNQRAIIKFSAYDFSIYGGLAALVTHISPNTLMDEQGDSFYEVKLSTAKNYLGAEANPMPIIPGMTVSVDIITGRKTILSYLMKPILRARHRALRER